MKKVEEIKHQNLGNLYRFTLLENTKSRILKEDAKRDQKLKQFLHIQDLLADKQKTNEEIHKERMRAYEILKHKLDLETRKNLGIIILISIYRGARA